MYNSLSYFLNSLERQMHVLEEHHILFCSITVFLLNWKNAYGNYRSGQQGSLMYVTRWPVAFWAYKSATCQRYLKFNCCTTVWISYCLYFDQTNQNWCSLTICSPSRLWVWVGHLKHRYCNSCALPSYSCNISFRYTSIICIIRLFDKQP